MSISANPNYGVISAASATGETVSLSGTLGTPITVFSFALAPNDALCGWLIGCTTTAVPNFIDRGQVQKANWNRIGLSEQAAVYVSVNTGTDWVIPNDFQNGPYYVRAQLQSGDDQPAFGTGLPLKTIGAADAAGDWFILTNNSSNRFWTWEHTGNFGQTEGTIRLEISTTNAESGIIATGYYKAVAFTDP